MKIKKESLIEIAIARISLRIWKFTFSDNIITAHGVFHYGFIFSKASTHLPTAKSMEECKLCQRIVRKVGTNAWNHRGSVQRKQAKKDRIVRQRPGRRVRRR